MATRTDKNGVVWEVDAQGNPIRPAVAGGGSFIPKPVDQNAQMKAANQAQASQYDAPMAAAQLNKAQIDAQNAAAIQPDVARKAKADADAAESAARKALGQTPQDPQRADQIASILQNIDDLRGLSKENLSVGKMAGRVADFPVLGMFLGQNRANVEGALQNLQGDLIQQQITRLAQVNQGGVSQLANTEKEAERMAGSIANLSPDQSLDQFLKGLDRAEAYYVRQLDQMATTAPPETQQKVAAILAERKVPVTKADESRRDEVLFNDGGNEAPPGGFVPYGGKSRTENNPQWKGVNEAIKGMIVGGRPDEEISAFLASKGINAQGLTGLQQAKDYYRKTGKTNFRVDVDDIEVPMSGTEQFRNDAPQTRAGTMVATYLNAGAMGLPSLVAGDQIDALRDVNPGYAMAGDIAGAVTGTGLFGLAGKSALKAVPSKFGPTIDKLASKPIVGDLARDVGYGATYGATTEGDPVTGALFATAGNLGGRAIVGGGRAAAGRGGEIVGNPQDAAKSIVARNLPRDIDPVAALLAEGSDMGLPMVLADASPQMRSLAGAAFRRSSGDTRNSVSDFIGGRQAGQGERAMAAIESNFGPVSNPNRVAEALMKTAKTNADPLYASLRTQEPRTSPALEEMLNTGPGMAAMRRAAEIADAEQVAAGSMSIGIDSAGKPIFEATPNFQTLDYVKRGFDDVLEPSRNPVTGNLDLDSLGRATNDLRKRYVSEVDNLYPDYAQARAAWAGPASAKEAMQQGQSSLRMLPRDVQDQFARMSPEQQEMYRLGQRVSMADTVGRTADSRNPFNTLYGTPQARERLAITYPDGSETFARQAALETEMARTGSELLGGSATAGRLAADEAMQSGIAEQFLNAGVDTALTGAPIRSMAGAVADIGKLGISGRREGVANEIAQLLTQQGDPDLIEMLLVQDLVRRGNINRYGGYGSQIGASGAVALGVGRE